MLISGVPGLTACDAEAATVGEAGAKKRALGELVSDDRASADPVGPRVSEQVDEPVCGIDAVAEGDADEVAVGIDDKDSDIDPVTLAVIVGVVGGSDGAWVGVRDAAWL